jgi:signal transduction histidine kinase
MCLLPNHAYKKEELYTGGNFMTVGRVIEQRRGSISFRPHARLIRLLGDELISDEVMALVELVKNGYDADASHLTITLENIADPAHGIISVRDDGDGMDLHTVLHVWMEPATPHKRNRRGKKIRTSRGRIQLGEKGVGRFAADKLGSELELITRQDGADEEIVLRVSWHHFDQDKYLDEVESTWFTREPQEFPDKSHGTLLIIRSLRTAWNHEMVVRLNNGLSRLVSPSTTGTDFVIETHCPEFPFASGRVMNRLLETAPYSLAGFIDTNGILHIQNTQERVIDLRPNCHKHFLDAQGDYRVPLCGPFSISLNVWDLELLTRKGYGIDRALREAIKASSGVSIYRDGFRIWPYGERDDDWLELNQRRVNNPTLRISNNQVIGFVEITHSGNPDLRDRTSREGLLDTPALFDLKALVLAALSELETERFAIRRELFPVQIASDSEEQDPLLWHLQQIHEKAGDRNKGRGLKADLREIEHLHRQHIEQERKRYNQVARLAGIGMAAELLTDAFSREVTNAVTILQALQGESRSITDSIILQMIEALSIRMEMINEKLDLMGPLYRSSLQENEPVDIRGAVYDVIAILNHQLVESKTKVNLTCEKILTVRMNRGHLMQALMILIENSLLSMQEIDMPEPCIEVKIVVEKGNSSLLISDSGPGIPSHLRKLIFEPYFSTRKAGRGLGLHVAKDILAGYNCSLELVSGKESLPGACFQVRFDQRRVMQ